ncbi:type VI secretion system-associated FHA domain protein TagH [Neptuniibacter sp. QD57_21]|uniref:type VI secretion system-associated FHA domain protein TagH n=1 Tax=Neptuniibacter sp. QD57_21 TaxID=3398213 RepID=UPI0039F52A41
MSAILQLRLIAFRGLAPAVSQMREFDQDEVLIGRAPDNDFVVEDPERYCSRYHARCYRADNQFFVEDTSTPGTQVNAGHHLGRGHRHRLVSGDLLHIGECQIQVDLIESAQPVAAQEVGAFSIDDFFSDGGASDQIEAPVNKVPLPNIPHTTSADFYDSIAPQNNMPPRHVDGYEVESHEQHFADPATSVSIEQNAAQAVTMQAVTMDDAPVAPVPVEQPYMEQHLDAYDQAVVMPEVNAAHVSSQISDALIPEVQPVPSTVQQAPVHEAVVEEALVQEAIVQQASAQQSPAQQAPKSDVDSLAIKAFLQGLDVQPSDLVGRNKEEIMFSAGQMLRVLTQGIMEILLSRNDVKKEFGMDVTRIGAQQNNPLKFSQNSGEAMIKLLTEAEGYMSAHEAVKEGVVDAKAHQVAVMSGMQSAIVSMLERFRPESLEEQLTSKFVLSRKGKYWEMYKDAYQQLVSEAEDDFNALFGDEFTQVYQQQVREIESSYSQD